MTISRVWQTGWESGGILECDTKNGTVAVQASDARTGTYTIAVAINSSNNYFIQSVPATNQVVTGFSFYPQELLTSEGEIAILVGSASDMINLSIIPSTGDLRLYVTGTSQGITTDHPIDAGVFYHIGIDCNIDSSGWVYVYLDGSEILSVTGDLGTEQIENIHYGTYRDQGTSVGNPYFRYDDVYIDDTTGEGSATAPSIKRFYALIPNNDGSYLQWIPSPTGTHYTLVDERPNDGDSTYVYAITGSLYDSYQMSTFTLDVNEDIIAMIPFSISKREGSTEQIALGTLSSGTLLVGNDQDLTLSYNYYWERQITGSLGSPWNQSYMDSIQTVIKSAGTY